MSAALGMLDKGFNSLVNWLGWVVPFFIDFIDFHRYALNFAQIELQSHLCDSTATVINTRNFIVN